MITKFNINDLIVELDDLKKDDKSVSFLLNGTRYEYSLVLSYKNKTILKYKDKSLHALISNNQILYKDDCNNVARESSLKKSRSQSSANPGAMISPMPGKIFKILSSVGNIVKKGDVILILEAMKMEHSVKASSNGVVKELFYKEGELVDGGVLLATLEAVEEFKEC
ncbi:MAG: biotin/lipoyl-binding protein [Bacteriovoracaceae bacterium]|jgi:biotin carboxyl carrier protein|nr:biotin/lipoyl-binding protein [Bacteriovoracaceae bacterium]